MVRLDSTHLASHGDVTICVDSFSGGPISTVEDRPIPLIPSAAQRGRETSAQRGAARLRAFGPTLGVIGGATSSTKSDRRTDNQTNLDTMKNGFEWLISQDDRPGIFQGKLAVGRLITMGHSEES
jgi:hypothetical protein